MKVSLGQITSIFYWAIKPAKLSIPFKSCSFVHMLISIRFAPALVILCTKCPAQGLIQNFSATGLQVFEVRWGCKLPSPNPSLVALLSQLFFFCVCVNWGLMGYQLCFCAEKRTGMANLGLSSPHSPHPRGSKGKRTLVQAGHISPQKVGNDTQENNQRVGSQVVNLSFLRSL